MNVSEGSSPPRPATTASRSPSPPGSSAWPRRSAFPRTPTRSRSRRCAGSAPSSSSTGSDFDDAREHCEALALEHGYRYVHSGNEPLLIAGVATGTLEILEEQPATDVIVVPVGGGSGAAGACIVAKAVNPEVRVIGVQSEAAPTAYRSWRERRLVEDRMETAAEGLATRTAFELPQRILWESLDDFVLVGDDEIREAQLLMIETTRNLVELSGAAPLAAALALREELAGKRVALVLSGGNASRQQLADALAAALTVTRRRRRAARSGRATARTHRPCRSRATAPDRARPPVAPGRPPPSTRSTTASRAS